MAITQTGTTVDTHSGGSTAETGQFYDFIPVPADAELVIAAVSGYTGDANGFASLLMEKGGSFTAMTKLNSADVSGSEWQAAMFYMVAPDTGDEQRINWDWVSGSDTHVVCSVTFWKGVDTASPIRDSDAFQGNGIPMTTPTLTAQTGDKLLAFFGGYTGGSNGTVDSWTGATTLANNANHDYIDSAWGSANPTGNQTVEVTSVTSFGANDSALCAVVIKPAAAGYTLAAAAGSYAFTGTDATTRHAWTTPATAGAYAFTGSAATLTKSGAESPADWDADLSGGSVSGTTFTANQDGGGSTYSVTTHTTGKWYAEVTFTSMGDGLSSEVFVGIANEGALIANLWYEDLGVFSAPTGIMLGFDPDFTVGDIVSIAADLDTLKFWARKNGGTWRPGTPPSGTPSVIEGTAIFHVVASVSEDGILELDTASFAFTPPTGFSGWSAQAYSLTAVAGSYAFTGTAATPLHVHKITADPASYAFTGTAASLTPGSSISHTATYQSSDTDTTTLSDNQTYTFAMTDALAGAGRERLVLIGGALAPAATADFDAVTVDGVTATRIALARGPNDGGGAHAQLSAWRAALTGNTTFNVVATFNGFSGSAFSGACVLYSILNAGNLEATATAASNDPTLDVAAAANGLVVAGLFGYSQTDSGTVWSGLTEDVDALRVFSTDLTSTASASNVIAATPRAISADITPNLDGSTDSVASLVLAFRPYSGAWIAADPAAYAFAGTAATLFHGGLPSTITQTGSTLVFNVPSNANTGTASSSITVPSDAEIVVVGVSGYQGTSNGIAAMTFTKGGIDTAMTKVTGGDAGTSWQSAMFWQNAPDTGIGKELKWDWTGSGTSADPVWQYSVTFWKGVDTSSPVRDSDGIIGTAFPLDTPTLTAQAGDLIVGFFGGYTGGSEGSVTAWSNLATLTDNTKQDYNDSAWGSGSPTGSTAVGVTSVSAFSQGGLSALVLKPAAANNYTLSAVAGSYAFTGSDVVIGRALVVPAGSYAFTGTDASMTASGSPAAISFDAFDADTTILSNGQTYTFPLTVAAASGQERLVILTGIGTGTTWDFSDVTVDGQTATRVGVLSRGDPTGGVTSVVSGYRAAGTAGTVINVVATFSGFGQNLYMGTCACFKLSSATTLLDQTNSVTITGQTLDIDTATDGVVAALVSGFSAGATTTTWSGLTECLDTMDSAALFTAAIANVSSGQTPRAISVVFDPADSFDAVGGTDSVTGLALSFNSASGGGGATSFTLSAAAGSYAFTGTPATPSKTGQTVAVTYEAADTDATINGDGGVYIFPLTVGGASGQERIAVLSGTGITPANADFNACSIDGQTGVRIGSVVRGLDDGSNVCQFLTMYRAPGTASTAINVTATFDGNTCYGASCALYTLAHGGPEIATASATTDDPTLSLNTDNEGAVIGAFTGYSESAPLVAWTGLTEDFDGVRTYADQVFSGASISNIPSGESPRTITVNNTPNLFPGTPTNSLAAMTVSIRPTAVGSELSANAGAYLFTGTEVITGTGMIVQEGSYLFTGSTVELTEQTVGGLNVPVTGVSLTAAMGDVTVVVGTGISFAVSGESVTVSQGSVTAGTQSGVIVQVTGMSMVMPVSYVGVNGPASGGAGGSKGASTGLLVDVGALMGG